MARVTPWGVARRIFGVTPSHYPLLDKLVFWRSTLGMATLILVNFGVRAPTDVLYDEGVDKAWMNTLYGFCAVPVAMVVMYFYTDVRYRRDFDFTRTILRLVALLGTIALPMVLLFVIGVFPDPDAWFTGDRHLAVRIALGVAMTWFAVYFIAVAYWAGRTYFWIGDFHPLLGPTVTTLMVVVLTAVGVVTADTKGLAWDVWLVLQAGGLLTTVALAVWEYRLYRGEGIGWRTGPHPHAGQPGTRRGNPPEPRSTASGTP